MEKAKHVNVSINTAALQGGYLTDIQNLLDVITFFYAGESCVTAELYQNQSQRGFMTFHPAENRRLSYGDEKKGDVHEIITSYSDQIKIRLFYSLLSSAH